MLPELNIESSTFDQFIKPHKDFLDFTSGKEQIEWSEILMRKHPDLLAFRNSIRNLVKPRDAMSASVYTLSSARTFLTCHYLLESTHKPVIVNKNEVQEYTSSMLDELQYLIRQRSYDPVTNVELRARTMFFAEGAYPPSAVSWMANFFNGNTNLAVNFLLPENSYPPESERFMYRGILDIAYPIGNALRKKQDIQYVDPRLLPVKI